MLEAEHTADYLAVGIEQWRNVAFKQDFLATGVQQQAVVGEVDGMSAAQAEPERIGGQALGEVVAQPHHLVDLLADGRTGRHAGQGGCHRIDAVDALRQAEGNDTIVDGLQRDAGPFAASVELGSCQPSLFCGFAALDQPGRQQGGQQQAGGGDQGKQRQVEVAQDNVALDVEGEGAGSWMPACG